MPFSNQSVTADLISLEAIDLEPLTLRYRKLNLGLTIVTHMLIIGVAFTLNFQPFFEMPAFFQNHFYWIVLALAILAMTELTYHWFADQVKAYALREHDIHYRSGLFFRKHICQPLLRVQHIEIKRGPFERKAGLATLQVFSAGGAMQTFNIPGLAHDTAIKLRSYILGHEDLTIDE